MSAGKQRGPIGQLAEHASGYYAHLLGLGYSPSAAKKHRQLVAHLGRWLDREGIPVAELTAVATEGFFAARRAHGTPNLRSPRSLHPLLDYLRHRHVLVERVTAALSDPVDVFILDYRCYLLAERALAEGTVRFYVYIAGLLAAERRRDGGVSWASLRAGDVTEFLTRTCVGRGISSARQVVSALRSVLRFLVMRGEIELALDHAVLSVAGRSSALPRGISSADLETLVAACDTTSAIGRRDRAIVLLLARLGLRGGEVIGLGLDDVDWRSGEIVVVGKGGRRDRLPLPADVGQALADYLEVRPRVEDRTIFLRQCAPIRRLAETGAIRAVLERACDRAGIPYANPHRLRHSVATGMLRGGASLRDIGHVLGHQATAVTATYAKVDLCTLQALARPWPEVRS